MTQPTLRNSTRTGFAVIALTAAGIGLGATGANAATPTNVWDNLAQCESSGNWNINTGNGYSGGLQFSPSTWAAFGGTGSAANASREQQIAVAERVQAGQGWGAWPSCSAKLGLSGAPAPAQAAPVQQYVAPAQAAPVKQYVAPAPAQAAPVQQYVAPAQAAPAQQYVAPVQAAPRHVAPVALSGESYTVQSGDSLSKIAQKLNIAGGWQRLADANAASVANPHLIFVGQVLNLPA